MMYDFGFIAIGDEITDGDILNTNTSYFAKYLIKKGFETGNHVECKDQLRDIHLSISFLKSQHKNIIITGGLGPTEDDLTSEAIAKYFNKKLELDTESWLTIKKRMIIKYGKIIYVAKKQAMFPYGVKIILNNKGTANGFELDFADKYKLYVLPGPPEECIPMFENIFSGVNLINRTIRKSWNIYNIGESLLAEKLNQIKEEYSSVTFKYRLDAKFIELKYFYDTYCTNSEKIITSVENLLRKYL